MVAAESVVAVERETLVVGLVGRVVAVDDARSGVAVVCEVLVVVETVLEPTVDLEVEVNVVVTVD